MEIVKSFSFEAAHYLPRLPESHKCRRMHGHSFRFDVHVEGPVDPESGWVMDFGDVSTVVRPLVEILDHNLLNDIPGLDNPTSEMIAIWLWSRIQPLLPGLAKIVVRETCTAHCEYKGK